MIWSVRLRQFRQAGNREFQPALLLTTKPSLWLSLDFRSLAHLSNKYAMIDQGYRGPKTASAGYSVPYL